MVLNKRILFIHSDDRELGAENDFTIRLDTGIANVKEVKLLSCVIPSSYYNITTSNNKINTNLGIITVPPGRYNIDELRADLLTRMDTLMTNPPTAINYNRVTMKLEFVMGADSITFQFAGNPNQMNDVLGWDQTNVTLTGSTTVIPPHVVDLSFPQYIFINCKQLGSRTMSTDLDLPTFVVPSVAPRETLQIYCDKTHYDQFITYDPPISLKTLDFRLTTLGNQLLDLNGAEWHLLLEITNENH